MNKWTMIISDWGNKGIGFTVTQKRCTCNTDKFIYKTTKHIKENTHTCQMCSKNSLDVRKLEFHKKNEHKNSEDNIATYMTEDEEQLEALK